MSKEVRDIDVRDPLVKESLADGLWRKIRACVGVTSAIDLWGCSRSRTRIDMAERTKDLVQGLDLVASWNLCGSTASCLVVRRAVMVRLAGIKVRRGYLVSRLGSRVTEYKGGS